MMKSLTTNLISAFFGVGDMNFEPLRLVTPSPRHASSKQIHLVFTPKTSCFVGESDFKQSMSQLRKYNNIFNAS